MQFSRPEYWSRQPFPSPGDLPNPEIEPRSPALQADSSPLTYLGSPNRNAAAAAKLLQSCPTLCNPMDYIVHGILQARTLEWVVSPLSRRSSQPKGQTQVSSIAGRVFTSWAPREALWNEMIIIWHPCFWFKNATLPTGTMLILHSSKPP